MLDKATLGNQILELLLGDVIVVYAMFLAGPRIASGVYVRLTDIQQGQIDARLMLKRKRPGLRLRSSFVWVDLPLPLGPEMTTGR